MDRIYLDNAATSWPKPPAVYEAVDRYLQDNGAPAGRGGYTEAQEVERVIGSARRRAAKLFNAENAKSVVFTFNGTDSLNLALHGLLREGDHVVTSLLEHNSVLRPLHWLETHRNVESSYVATGGDTVLSVDDIRAEIRPNTRLIAITQMSNVTGAMQPVRSICKLAAEHGIPCLIDAAQAAGHDPMPWADLGDAMIACPSHKGLLGPLGGGLLYVSPNLASRLEPVRQGGTGTSSEHAAQPSTLPDRYESGNHNVPAIVGLESGLAYLEQLGQEEIQNRLALRRDELLDGLEAIDGVTVFGPRDRGLRGPVIPFRIDGFAPQEVAGMLDTGRRIHVRAGFLCAPRIHELIGTTDGGVVRLSPGIFTTAEQTATALEEIAEIASMV